MARANALGPLPGKQELSVKGRLLRRSKAGGATFEMQVQRR